MVTTKGEQSVVIKLQQLQLYLFFICLNAVIFVVIAFPLQIVFNWKFFLSLIFRYVLLVDADTHSSLTLHVRNEDGYYSRRNCNTRPVIVPPNIPPHLYGQMVQTTQGTTALRKFGDLPQLIDTIDQAKCTDERECLELKAAIWAIGHASTHSNGIEYFLDTDQRYVLNKKANYNLSYIL